MDYYRNALEAMHLLFDKTGVNYWRDWIEKDLHEWEKKSVDHHLSAYGGMGSLNDVIICPENGHNVSAIQVSWINCLFDDLKSLCYQFAKSKGNSIPEEEIQKALWNKGSIIQGWRCLACGYSELSIKDIENYVSYYWIRSYIVKAVIDGRLKEFVEQILSHNTPGVEKERTKIKEIAGNSNINVTDREGWLRPCPRCGGNDTAVYRWKKSQKKYFLKEVDIFIPTQDNLPLRN